MSSFYSERTLEYKLVPELCNIIQKHKKTVVPLFFRELREGTNLSSELFGDKKIRVLAMFARRGRLSHPKANLNFKINHSVIKMMKNLNGIDIPVIFGISNARTLMDLANSDVYWFSIQKPALSNTEDIYLNFDNKDLFIKENQIIQYINESDLFYFDEICCYLKELRCQEKMESSLPWFAGTWVYEPVYFFIIDK